MSICLIGNFCIDLIIRGVPHLPAWGQEVAGEDSLLTSSGQTTYTAFALRALREPVSVIGCVGEDAWGSQIRGDLESRGVDTEGLETVAGGRTALTVAAVRPDGERAFVSDFACLNHADENVIERRWSKVDQAQTVCLLGVFSWPGLSLTRTAALYRRMRQAGKVTMLDTGWDPGGWNPETQHGLRALLAETTIFMPNLDEAAAITGSTEPAEAARRLALLGPELVVVKLGSQGSLVLSAGRIIRQPALPVAVVDTVGAGDVFNAGFLHARERGEPLERCLRFGAATAAGYIGRKRDRFPSAEEVST
ncbi:MAG: carbohydrate kinase family protein [Spirochaetes bacterium]|nr:carbohydrate kinase family protein [Spirochaetota bacterium]